MTEEIIKITSNNIENIRRYLEFLCKEQIKTNKLLKEILKYIRP